jgi:hypothetical protein
MIYKYSLFSESQTMYQIFVTTTHKSGNAIHSIVLKFETKELADLVHDSLKLKNNNIITGVYREIEKLY